MSITLSDAFIEDFDGKVDEGNVEQGITNSETELSVINEVEEDIINNTIESVEYTEDEVLTNDNVSIVSGDAIENGNEENAIVQDENVVNYDVEQPANANTAAITILPAKRRAKASDDAEEDTYTIIGNILMRSKHADYISIPVQVKYNDTGIPLIKKGVELFVDDIQYAGNKVNISFLCNYIGYSGGAYAYYMLTFYYLNTNYEISPGLIKYVKIENALEKVEVSWDINNYKAPINIEEYLVVGGHDYGLSFAAPFITMVFNKNCSGILIGNIYYFGSTFDVYVPDNGKAIRDNNGNAMNYQIEMQFTFSIITEDNTGSVQIKDDFSVDSVSEREIELKNGTYQFCSENTCNSENEIMFHDNIFSFFLENFQDGERVDSVTLKDVKANIELLNGIETERYKIITVIK